MNKVKLNQLIHIIRSLSKRTTIPLHDPIFNGNEKKYLNDCIDSTFVSSVGKYVDLFEQKIKEFTKSKYAIATVNGTTALHISLIAHNVLPNDEIITSPLTFVATTSAIKHCYANPIFIDIVISNFIFKTA